MAINFKDFLKDVIDGFGEDNEIVEKSIPVKASWKKMHDELEELDEQFKELDKKIDAKKDLMWSTIQIETGEYVKHLRYNTETEEIEMRIPDPKKPRKPIKSPIQMGQ